MLVCDMNVISRTLSRRKTLITAVPLSSTRMHYQLTPSMRCCCCCCGTLCEQMAAGTLAAAAAVVFAAKARHASSRRRLCGGRPVAKSWVQQPPLLLYLPTWQTLFRRPR